MSEVNTLRIVEAKARVGKRARVAELSSESELGGFTSTGWEKSFEPLNQLWTLHEEFEYCSTHYLKI
jgi:hypothetical protein